MKYLALVAASVTLSTLTGCASIIKGGDDAVIIASEPAGASYEVRDATGRMVSQGTTPNTVTLKSGAGYFKGAEYSVLVKKEGYGAQTVNLKPNLSGWYFGNILIGGLIGMLGVDPATGAMYQLPDNAHATLVPMAHEPVASK